MMRDFIGTFTAPGTGEVGVLGIELMSDHKTGLSEGMVRLEKRPYCEGVTRCVIDLPATSERGATRLTGVWTHRGGFDGEGCNITVSSIRTQTIPAPTLDETTNPADVEWGEVRSACAAKDWRRAWEVVGTDHTGEATPGEAYIFGNARRLACVSAALRHWYLESLGMAGFGGRDKTWKDRYARIKVIAAWESSAAAQYAEPKAKRARAWREALERNTISTPRTVGGRAATIIIDDPPMSGAMDLMRPMGVTDEEFREYLRARQEGATNMRLYGNPAGGEDYTLTINGERQTYTVPASAMPDIADALRDYIGQPLTAATRAAVESTVRRVTQDSARVASGNAVISPNPAPHGPNRRRRR